MVFFNGATLPADIHDGIFVFLSRGDKDDDRDLCEEGVCRAPLDLRPLTLKNSDNTTVVGCLSWIIKPGVEQAACSLQNDLVDGRQLFQNTVDSDVAARRDALSFVQSLDDRSMSFCSEPLFSNVVHRDLLNTCLLVCCLIFEWFPQCFPCLGMFPLRIYWDT